MTSSTPDEREATTCTSISLSSQAVNLPPRFGICRSPQSCSSQKAHPCCIQLQRSTYIYALILPDFEKLSTPCTSIRAETQRRRKNIGTKVHFARLRLRSASTTSTLQHGDAFIGETSPWPRSSTTRGHPTAQFALELSASAMATLNTRYCTMVLTKRTAQGGEDGLEEEGQRVATGNNTS